MALLLLAAQALLVLPLFGGSYSQWRQSIEGGYLTDARFIAAHFPALSWNPVWYLGFPFEYSYVPLLPTLVAAFGKLNGDIAAAYRVVAALGYSAGTVGLFVLGRALGLRRGPALAAAVLFATVPLASVLFPQIREDATAFTGAGIPVPWRLAVLVEYGEGPHTLGFALELFGLVALHRYLSSKARRWLVVAVGLAVAVAFTNIIALTAFALLAIPLILFAPAAGGIGRGLRVAGLSMVFAASWYSPGFLRAVASYSGDSAGGSINFVVLAIVMLSATLAGVAACRWDRSAGVVAFWCVSLGAIVSAHFLFRVLLATEPGRYALELDAAVALAVVLLGERLRKRFPARTARWLGRIAIAGAVVALIPSWIAVQPQIRPAADWKTWSEREVSLWLEAHLRDGQRAYLSGDHAFWLDVFADVPQVKGGEGFAGVDPWWAHASYQINAASDVDTSIAWLRALRVGYVVVTGPGSTDTYADFTDPTMFEGRLPLAAEIQGARVYEVAAPSGLPLLVQPHGDPPAPSNALDRARLDSYVAVLGTGRPIAVDGSVSAAHVTGNLDTGPAGGTLLFGTSFDSGWRASVNGRRLSMRADTVGLLALDLPPGQVHVDIEHRPHSDFLLGVAAAAALAAILVIRSIRERVRAGGALRRMRQRRDVRPAAAAGERLLRLLARYADPLLTIVPAAAAIAVSVAIGGWSDVPRGGDAWSHVFKTRIFEVFPDAWRWVHTWAGGMPLFTVYPSIPYRAIALVTQTVGVSDIFVLNAFTVLGAALTCSILYQAARAAGAGRSTALSVAVIVAGTPALYSWAYINGTYLRLMALPGLSLAVLLVVRAAHGPVRLAQALASAMVVSVTFATQPYLGAGVVLILILGTAWMRGFSRELVQQSGACLLGILLDAAFLVPFAFSGLRGFAPSQVELGSATLQLASLADLLGLRDLSEPGRPYTLLAPGLLALMAIGVAAGRRAPVADWIAPRVTIGLLAGTLGAVVYSTVRFGDLPLYAGVLSPLTALPLVPVLLAVPAALVWDSACRGRRWRAPVALLIAASTLPWLAWSGAVAPTPWLSSDPLDRPSRVALNELGPAADDWNQRIGIGGVADLKQTLGIFRPLAPQTGDYNSQAEIHPDALFRLDAVVWRGLGSPREARALMDWWGIGAALAADEAETNQLRSLGLPIAAGGEVTAVRVSDPRPILAPTTTPAMLIFSGRRSDFDLVQLVLNMGGIGPDDAIPLRGSTLAASGSAALHGAAAVLLVDYVPSGPTEHAMLRDYLLAGGRLLFIGAVAPDLADLAPVTTAHASFNQWSLTASGPLAPLAGVDAMAPARYDGGPWDGDFGLPAAGANTLLLQRGDIGAPLSEFALAAETSNASVRWLGGNLVYHAAAYGSDVEARAIATFIADTAGSSRRLIELKRESLFTQSSPLGTVTFLSPEKRVVDVTAEATGVLFKENFYRNWHADLQGAAGRSGIPVYETAAGMMFVLLPNRIPGRLTLAYEPGPIDELGMAISAGTALLTAAFLAAAYLRRDRGQTSRSFRWHRR